MLGGRCGSFLGIPAPIRGRGSLFRPPGGESPPALPYAHLCLAPIRVNQCGSQGGGREFFVEVEEDRFKSIEKNLWKEDALVLKISYTHPQ